MRAREIAVGTKLVIELEERARADQFSAQALILRIGAVAPDHACGLGEFNHSGDPFAQAAVTHVRRRCGKIFGWFVHLVLSKMKTALDFAGPKYLHFLGAEL
jgi:hypothetical protein